MSDLAVPQRGPGRHASTAVWPAMPVVHPEEQTSGSPYPIRDGISPTIGWEWRSPSKGGPVFVIISRTVLGTLKVQESFPMTEEGWARAWAALATQSPENAAKVAETLQARVTDIRIRQMSSSGAHVTTELDRQSLGYLHDVALLGGYGPGQLTVGARYDVRFIDGYLALYQPRLPHGVAALRFADIEEIHIGGPGMVKTGGGFVGGGFGAAGALEGMALAAALNALTTRTTVTTVVRVQAVGAELFLLWTKQTPGQLRMALSRPLGEIRAARAAALAAASYPQAVPYAGGVPAHGAVPPPTAVTHAQGVPPAGSAAQVESLARLASMLQGGLITRAEFDLLKADLLSGR